MELLSRYKLWGPDTGRDLPSSVNCLTLHIGSTRVLGKNHRLVLLRSGKPPF